MVVALNFLTLYQEDEIYLIEQIIINDEIWIHFYYTFIRSLLIQHAFSECFFDISSAISWCGATIE